MPLTWCSKGCHRLTGLASGSLFPFLGDAFTSAKKGMASSRKSIFLESEIHTIADGGNVQGVRQAQGLHEQQGLVKGGERVRPAALVAERAAQRPQRLRQLLLLSCLLRLRLNGLRARPTVKRNIGRNLWQ